MEGLLLWIWDVPTLLDPPLVLRMFEEALYSFMTASRSLFDYLEVLDWFFLEEVLCIAKAVGLSRFYGSC